MSLFAKLRVLVVGAFLGSLVVFPALADPETLRHAFPGAAFGDLTGDGVADAVVQPADPDGLGAVVDGASEAEVAELPAFYLGLDWRRGASRIVTGNFDGAHGDDVLLQSRTRGGVQAVVLSDELGTPAYGVQTWRDGFLGRHWSARDATLYTGDFDGDSRGDLLVQVWNDDLFAAPYRESAYALLLADAGGVFSRINTTWDRDDFDADWDPAKYDLQVGDYDGDGIADIALLAKALTGTHQLLLGTPKGVFTGVAARWRGTATPAEAYARSIQGFSDAAHAASGEMYAEKKASGGSTDGISAMSFPAGTPAVGALAGEAGVSGGAATYSIPIVVPPGRAGMQPSVSVGYSSRGGNGELGMGWSLNAGSSIHRCPQTMAQDGRTLGVTYSQTTDRLCLDGQRLVAVSGTYGASGAAYRTEIESFVRVEQSGSHINDPAAKFLVRYDDGRLAYYGQSGATQFTPKDAPETLNWLLDRVEDKAGNSVVYLYDNTGTTGEYHLSEIKYTGRGTTQGDRKVAFTWEDRPDDTTSYLWKGRSLQTKRLSMITTWVSATAVREYRFSYGVSDATARSRLASIEECAFSSATRYCLPVTTFDWYVSGATQLQKGVVEFGIPAQDAADPTAWAWARNSSHKTSDGNAVRIDLNSTQDPQALVAFADIWGGTSPLNYEVSPGASFIGNGTRQLWYQGGNLAQMLDVGKYGVNVLTYANWPLIGQGFWEYEPDHHDKYADFNNDGRTDIFALTTILHTPGNPWGSYDARTNLPGNMVGNDWKVADFNGDGKVDAVMTRDVQAQGQNLDRELFSYKNITTNLQTPANNVMLFQQPASGTELTGEATHPLGGWYGPRLTRVLDIDGDALPDILFKAHDMPDAGQPVDRLLRNTSTVSAITFDDTTSPTTDPDDLYLWGDVNGDGLEDVVRKGEGPNDITAWQVKINRGGNEFGSATNLELPTPAIPCYDIWCEGGFAQVGKYAIRTGDVDNDGSAEILVPIARVATICMGDITYWSDDHGTWVTGPLCGNALFREVPDLLKYDASIYVYAAYRVVHAGGDDWTTADTGVRFKAPGTGFTLADATGDGLNDLVWSVNRISQMYYDTEEQGNSCGTNCSFTFPYYGNYLSIAKQAAPDMLFRATDGLGRTAEWTYDTLSSNKATLTNANLGEVVGSSPALYARSDDHVDDHHFHFTSTMYVVSEFRQTHHGRLGPSSGVEWCQGKPCDATWNKTAYAYRDAMFNNQGRGFQGFGQIIEEDPQRGFRTIHNFHQKFPWSGQLKSSVTERVDAAATDTASGNDVVGSGRNLSSVINSFLPAPLAAGVLPQAGVNYTPFQPVNDLTVTATATYTQAVVVSGSTSRSFDATTGLALVTATTANTYPAANTTVVARGCPTGSTTTTTDEFGTYTSAATNTWADKAIGAGWWVCQLTAKSATTSATINARHGQTAHSAPAKTLTTAYTYNTRRQVLTESVGPGAYVQGSWPNNAALTRTVTHAYNDTVGNVLYGNRIQTTTSGGSGATAIAPRTLYFDVWTADGYFNQRVRNDLGHLVFTYFNTAHGLPTQVVDPNFVDTYTQYDAFGRKSATWVEDLPVQTTTYADCGCSGIANTRYKVTTAQPGMPTQIAYVDALNRTLETRVLGFDGVYVRKNTYFDHLGRVREVSEPYPVGGTRYKTQTTEFDVLDRTKTALDAKGLSITYTYTGLVTAVTASDGTISQTTTQEKNTLGQLITSIDHYSNKTHFRYDAFGNPVSIKDAIGATVTAVHNDIGQKTSLSDPDMGSWTYAYDVLGQLKTQTDAKAQVTTFVYDVLGRMDSRTEPSGAGTCTTDWVYDTAANGLGKLKHVEQLCDGIKEEYVYDAKGRVTSVVTTLDDAEYAVDTTYDSNGRVDTVAYPDPASTGAPTGPPGAPTNVYTNPSTSFDGDISVLWSAPATGGAPTSYRVFKRRTGQAWGAYDTVTPPTMFFSYFGLGLGFWEFKVQACNADGCGPDSDIAYGEVENGGFKQEVARRDAPGARLADLDDRMARLNARRNASADPKRGRSAPGISPLALTSSYGTRFVVKHVYNANGHLAEVQDANGAGLIWKATALNGYGAVTAEQYGNNLTGTRVYGMAGAPFVTGITTSGNVQGLSYVWSKFGHLTQRKSSNTGITPNTMEENFVYDLINRLDTAQVKINNGSAVTVMDLAYDAGGNITQKIDTTGTKNYAYHATKKHAVTGITGTASQTFAYDANGNMSTRNGVTQVWNAANLPTTLATSTYTATFSYGPTRARYKQTAIYSGRTETTRYVGSLYEKLSRTDQSGFQHRYRVFAYGRPVAQVTDFSASSTRQTRYLHGDHLGSIDAITNEAGAVITDGRMSFDAHGNRRAAISSQGTAWQTILKYPANAALIDGLRSVTPRGFTDHEMLDNVGLIHMNGRVYDPAIGRFLSVDPVFQFPENTQSLNPYSYVLNSPLSATDPSGYATCDAGESTSCLEDGMNTVKMEDGSTQQVYVGKNGEKVEYKNTRTGERESATLQNGKKTVFGANESGKGPDTIGGLSERSLDITGTAQADSSAANGNGNNPVPTLPSEQLAVLREGGEKAQAASDAAGTEACFAVCKKSASNTDPNAPSWARGPIITSRSEISCGTSASMCPTGYDYDGQGHVHEGVNGDGRARVTSGDLKNIRDSQQRALTATAIDRARRGYIEIQHDAYRMSDQDHSLQDSSGGRVNVYLYDPDDAVHYRRNGTDYLYPRVQPCQPPVC